RGKGPSATQRPSRSSIWGKARRISLSRSGTNSSVDPMEADEGQVAIGTWHRAPALHDRYRSSDRHDQIWSAETKELGASSTALVVSIITLLRVSGTHLFSATS